MAISQIKALLKGKKFITVLNSEPYVHYKSHKGIKVKRGSGGAQHLMDYIMKKTGGMTVAIGSGNADAEVVGKDNTVQVPPGKESYTHKRLFLAKDQINDFYYGFSNQTLWPLCHIAFVKPLFERRWWLAYKKVNEQFAEEILKEVGDEEAFIWVNDYQLCLLPKLLKDKNPKLHVGMFWHIPWPIQELFSICPWSRELVEGMIAADFIGFHQESYVANFIDTAVTELKIDIRPNGNTLYYKKHITRINALPAGIDYQEIDRIITELAPEPDAVKKEFDIDYEQLIVGVDRVDYTKGLLERITILDSFFKTYPEFKGKLVHLLIGSPSRELVPAYKEFTAQLVKAIDQLNWKYSEGSWNPVYFLHEAIDPNRVYKYYNAADVCMVSSLDDGMNLVSKEYPICADQGKGTLILSKYAGSSKELKSAFMINPYNIQDAVEKLHTALTLSTTEKIERMDQMREVLKKNNIDAWAKKFIENTLSDGC